jgi:hypothetical protein
MKVLSILLFILTTLYHNSGQNCYASDNTKPSKFYYTVNEEVTLKLVNQSKSNVKVKYAKTKGASLITVEVKAGESVKINTYEKAKVYSNTDVVLFSVTKEMHNTEQVIAK